MNVQNGIRLSLFFLMTVLLIAQGKPELQITIQDEKVNMTPAERRGTAEIKHQPGDTIRYLVRAANVGNGALTEAVVVAQIPESTTFVPGSVQAEAGEAQFSIDKGKTYMPWPVTYWATDAQGKKIQKEAGPEMITQIQWRVGLTMQPGQITDMTYLVVIKP